MKGPWFQNYWDVEREMARLDFRMPSTRLFITDHGPGAFRLGLEIQTRDTYNPENPALISILHQQAVPLMMPSDHLIHTVRQHIHRAFAHEADEWLLVDGVRIFDPHKDQT